jgi:hypothetical protein
MSYQLNWSAGANDNMLAGNGSGASEPRLVRPVDDRDFKRNILPGVQGVTLRRILEVTGLSKRFA